MRTCYDCQKPAKRRQHCRLCETMICGRCYQFNHYHEIEARRTDAADEAWVRLYGRRPAPA